MAKTKKIVEKVLIELARQGIGEIASVRMQDAVESGPSEAVIAARKNPHAMCEECPLRHMQFKYVPGRGDARDPLAIVVGEAPGVDEVIGRKPFIGASGQLMRSTLNKVGLESTRVWYTNAVACHPPENKLDAYKDAIDCCRPRLAHELSVIGSDEVPIIAAGKTSAESVVKLTRGTHAPRSVKITTERGTWFPPDRSGHVNKSMLATVHPAYVLRVPQVMPEFEDDLRSVVEGEPEHPLQHAPAELWPRTADELAYALAEIADGETISFDVETSNVLWYTRPGDRQELLLMIGIARSTREGIIIGRQLLYSEPSAVKTLVNDLFRRTRTVAHNGKFDVLWLRRWGFVDARVDYDTMLAHGCVKETPPHGLKDLAKAMYHIRDYEADLILDYFPNQGDRDYSLVPEPKLGAYLAWDLAVTYQLWHDFEPRIRKEQTYEMPYINMLMPASAAFVKIEERGIKLDIPYLRSVQDMMRTHVQESLVKLRQMSGRHEFNPNSTQQVATVLFDDLGFKPTNSKHFPYRSTSAGALKQGSADMQSHPFTVEFQKHRRIKKLLSSYVEPMLDFADVNGYIHSSYRLLGAETGRLSAVDPAVQTLPRAARDIYGPMIRAAVVAPEGYKLVIADFSQAEMRVWAHLCQDPFLLNVYRAGRDLHTEGAIHLFGKEHTKEQRTWVKNFNFAYVYGGNEYSFAGQYNLPIETARAFVHEYERMMTVARQWRTDVFHEAVERGFVRTMFNRYRRFPLINEETLEEIKKVSWNFPPQSIASDLALLSVIRLVNVHDVPVVVTVHDSIGAYARDDEADAVGKLMTDTMVEIASTYVDSIPWAADVEIQDRWALRTDDDLKLIGDV